MILYREDLEREKPFIDLDTKNHSFVRMSMVLKQMGIKNRYFFLALHQPELADVDPFDYDNLTPELMHKIAVECKLNIWYFLREVVRIPIPGGDPIRFILNRANLAAAWTFVNDIDYSLIQPRQTGKTYGTQANVAWLMYIAAKKLDIGMITKDGKLVQDNVSRLKELRDALPKYLVRKTSRDWDRKEGLSYAEMKNYYKTFTAPIDESSAYKLGRGATMGAIHFDEIAYLKFNKIIVSTAVSSMINASENVRAAGLPSPVIFTTTAGNPDTEEGAYSLSLMQNSLPFSEAFYDLKNREELLSVIANYTNAKRMHLEFSYKQLGKTDAWLKDVCTRVHYTQDEINRDFLNIWQSATDKSVIPKNLINILRESKRDPIFTEISDGFVIRWYIPREMRESYTFKGSSIIMGMDTAEGVGRDFTTFCMVNPKNMSVLATCRCNDSNTIKVAKHVLKLLLEFPKLVYIPERNNTGVGIIDYILEGLQEKNINPFFRIYNEAVQDKGSQDRFSKVNIYDFKNIAGQVRSAFGFRTRGGTTGTARNHLYKVTMMKALEMNASRVYDSSIVNEFCNLMVRNGRIDHPTGCHDDTVIAYLLSSYLVFFGKNLQHYGLSGEEILSDVPVNGVMVTQDMKQEQYSIIQQINKLEYNLLATNDYSTKVVIERELNRLRPMVDERILEVQPNSLHQIKYEEKIQNSGADVVNQLNTFANRYLRIRR